MAIIHMHKAVLGNLNMFVFPMSFIKVRNLYGYISKLIKFSVNLPRITQPFMKELKVISVLALHVYRNIKNRDTFHF